MSAASDPGHIGDQWYTINEVAAVMRVSKMTVYRLVHGNALSAFRIGSSYRITSTDLTEFLASARSVSGDWLGPQLDTP